MSKPKISIIVPIYNVEKYLKRCLESLINQTLKEIEIILVDDESPDNCAFICEEYATKDSRISVIHKKNGGLGLARNSGLEIATGEYVAFVDSDDYVDLEMYEKLFKTAKENALDTIYSGFNNVDFNLKIHPISEVSSLQIFDSPKSVNEVLIDMIASEPSIKRERKYRMSVWHGIYSRDLITKNKIKFCSERDFISEDIIFHIDYLSKSSRIAFLPDSFYFYCFNDNSLTKVFREDRFEKAKTLYNEINRKLISKGFTEKFFKNRTDRFLIGYARYSLVGLSKADISYKKRKKLANIICNDLIWEAMSNYPISKMPNKQKLVMYLIKHKMVDLLLLICKYRGR